MVEAKTVKKKSTKDVKKYLNTRHKEISSEVNNLSSQVTIQVNNLEAMKARLNMLLGAKAELEDAMTKFSGENGDNS